MVDKEKIPRHIAIIMDGNGRWAKKQGLPKIEGHRAGVDVVEEVIKASIELGIEILSLFTFSTENWQRPKNEVKALMGLLKYSLNRYLVKLQKNNIKFVISGKQDGLPLPLQRQIQQVINQTQNNHKLILNLALNYGSREEIVQAAKQIALEVKDGALDIEQIDQRLFARHLYTADLPDPELLIRTSGEQRLSNFFLWQLSYTEFYFTPKLWPDFKKEDLRQAVSDFQNRARRYGR